MVSSTEISNCNVSPLSLFLSLPLLSGCLVPQELEIRNVELERRVQSAEQSLANSLEERDRIESEVQRVIEILDVKIFDLNDLRQSLVKLIDK